MPSTPFEPNLRQAIMAIVTAPFVTIRDFFADLIDSDERLRDQDELGPRLVGFLTLPFRLLLAGLMFLIYSWATSRQGLAFFWGLPAFAVIAGFIGALILADFIYNEARMVSTNTGYYEFHSQRSPEHPDWAEMFARKLIDIKPQDPQQKYRLGVSLGLGRHDFEAGDIMRSIAPMDGKGYGQAHVWLANQLLTPNADTPVSEADEERAIEHLERAYQSDTEDTRAPFALAQLYQKKAERLEPGDPAIGELLGLANEEYEKVIAGEQTYYRVASLQPYLKVRLKLIEMFPEEYSREEIETKIRGEVGELLSMTRRRFANEIFIWQTIVECLVELKDYKQAFEVTKAQFDRTTDRTLKAGLLRLISRVLLLDAREMQGTDADALYHFRLMKVCTAIKFNPADKAAYAMLLDFIGRPAAAESSRFLGAPVPVDIRKLQEEGAGSDYGGVIYALVGMHKISQSDISGGRKSWAIGQEFDARTWLYIYQLLDVAATIDDNRFDNMLEMVTLAIELFPEQPLLYVTRGNYYKKQSRYLDAIKDFEHVVENLPNELVINQQLKFCYEKLGDQANADLQQQIIARKLTERDDQQRQQLEQLLQRLEAIENGE